MSEQILVVEDNSATADMICSTLEMQGYEVEVVGDGIKALAKVTHQPPDLILLDIGLPGITGLEVCRFVRQRDEYIPIIMLTGQRSPRDKVDGLEMGADDYITKPFGARELLARVHAVLRLAQRTQPPDDKPRIEIGELVIDQDSRTVTLYGQVIELTRKEFDLLTLLALNQGKVFARDTLFEKVWGYNYVGKSRTLDVHIQQLRSKIEPDPAAPRYLITVRGVGYKFAE